MHAGKYYLGGAAYVAVKLQGQIFLAARCSQRLGVESQELNQKSKQPTQKNQPLHPLPDYQLPPVASRLPASNLSRVNSFCLHKELVHINIYTTGYPFMVLVLGNTATGSWRTELGKPSHSSPSVVQHLSLSPKG